MTALKDAGNKQQLQAVATLHASCAFSKPNPARTTSNFYRFANDHVIDAFKSQLCRVGAGAGPCPE